VFVSCNKQKDQQI